MLIAKEAAGPGRQMHFGRDPAAHVAGLADKAGFHTRIFSHLCSVINQPWGLGPLAATTITEFTLLKTILMLLATPGMMAPAETATKPAINAYSIRSWPRRSFQILHLVTS